MVLLAGILTGSTGALGLKWKDDRVGEQEYERLRDTVFETDLLTGLIGSEDPASDLPVIDGKKLKEINEDYEAWLYIPESPVDYPVVFPKSNQEYLKKTFDGDERACGCLFFDVETEPFTSLNTVIHGHNMRSGSMFGTLKKFMDAEYQTDHDRLYVHKDGEWRMYQFLSCYLADSTDMFPYQTMFLSRTDFEKYLSNVLEKGAGGQNVMAADEINAVLTLSTCYGKYKKLILQWAEMKN